MGRSGNVQAPHTVDFFIDKAERFVVTRFQPTKPLAQRKHIMLAQILDVADFEPRRFCGGEHDWHGWSVAIRENVLVDK